MLAWMMKTSWWFLQIQWHATKIKTMYWGEKSRFMECTLIIFYFFNDHLASLAWKIVKNNHKEGGDLQSFKEIYEIHFNS
jgi:hypothetical protein